MAEGLSDSRAGELNAPGAELTLAEALAHVPGYVRGDPSIQMTRLAGGSVNRSHSVSTPAGRFVVRLTPVADAWLASDRSVERTLHNAAAAVGIAPRIVHADEHDRWLITELIEGRLWAERDFADPVSLVRLGEVLQRLHQIPAPGYGRFDLLGALRGYVERLRVLNAAPPEHHLDEASRAWRISGASDRPLAVLHHDLHGSNLIEGQRGLMLIDWECAAVSDPLLDIACILSYYDVAWPHVALLLEHSGLAGVTASQVGAAVWLFDLHTFLWYRERRSRLVPTAAELEAEARLERRLALTGVTGR
jgi:thiamine kinase